MAVAVSMVIVCVWVFCRSQVVHLVHTATLWATLNGALARSSEPNGNVGISRGTGTTTVLFISKGFDHNGVIERAFPGSIQWLHVENVNACHFPKNFKSFQTSCLLEIGRNGSGNSSRCEQILLGFDLWTNSLVSLSSKPQAS